VDRDDLGRSDPDGRDRERWFGFALRESPGLRLFSPMILSMIVGTVFHNVVGTPLRAKAGVVFSLRRILRLAIILVGLQLTAQEVIEVGATGWLSSSSLW
jgi:uncharacterized membrane protein YadS